MIAQPVPPESPQEPAAQSRLLSAASLLHHGDALPWLEMVQSFTAAGLWLNDFETFQCLWSPQMFDLHGLPLRSAAPDLDEWIQVVVEEDRERVRSLCRPADGIATPFDLEYRIHHAQSGERWMQAMGRISKRDAGGRPLRVTGVVIDVTERYDAQRALARSERRYRWLLENAANTMWLFDLEKPVSIDLSVEEQIGHLYAHAYLAETNQTMAQMYGYAETFDMRGLRFGKVLPRDDARNVETLRRFITQGYRILDAEATAYDGDGRELQIANNLYGMVENGELTCVWGMRHDITRDRQWEKQLREADARKDEFLAVLAHELRNPLAPVRTALDLWRVMPPADPRLLWAREIATRQIEHMTRLVDDLLDISRITHGTVTLQPEPFDLRDVLDEIGETQRPLLEQRGQTLEMAVEPGAFPMHADRTRLLQVIGNLVDNASKFSADGACLWITVARADGTAKIRVRDEGRGIAASDLPHIFEMFVQSGGSDGETRRGLGIGLTLVRALVELHGGRIEVQSGGEGLGTEVDIWLPLSVAASVQSLVEHVPPRAMPAVPPGTRILLVDDNVDAAQSLALLLGMRGYDISTAFSGREALLAAQRMQPHAVLLDIGLPDTDGYAVARELRSTEWGRSMAIIALTGYGQDDDKRLARDAGFDLHLTKPVAPHTLEARLAELVSRVTPTA